MRSNPQESADLVTFTEGTLTGKFIDFFQKSVKVEIFQNIVF